MAPTKEASMKRFMLGCTLVLALCGVVASGAAARPAPQTVPGDPLDPRTYAPQSELFLIAHAAGVQKYTCESNGSWLFTDPEASLYKSTQKPAGKHFLDFETGRPSWQWKDGSSVEAARKVSVAVTMDRIAWLLLRSTSTGRGSDGDRLASTAWVQRLNTVGGLAPAAACVPGTKLAVPYEADYYFWKAKD
jgi:hypothetical protein